MTDYMKEAERLLDEYQLQVSAVAESRDAKAWLEHRTATHLALQARSALLAHIQRGAVPVYCTPTEHEGRIVYEHTSEPIPNADGFVLYAPAPDQFRDAAEIVDKPADDRIAAAIHYPECWDTAAYPTAESALAEVFAHYRCTEHDAPAEVPMPEPDMSVWDTEEVRTYSDECIQQYGAACRAAGEAAGYARGLNERNAGDETLAREIDLVMSDDGVALTPGAFRALSFVRAALRGEVKP